ncbi:ML domain-containing protein [Chlamydoabsidia padenii]|nr:ML domain-containing protein [Chlamydoabsidia padenii]
MKFIYLALIMATVVNSVVADYSIELQKFNETVYHEHGKAISMCDNEKDLISMESFEITPDPPVKGKPLRIMAKGNLKKDVGKGSYLTISIMYGSIQFSQQKLDICKEVGLISQRCPLKKGPLTITKDTDIPGFIPGGKYTIDVKLFTAEGERLTCIHGNLKFPGLFGK